MITLKSWLRQGWGVTHVWGSEPVPVRGPSTGAGQQPRPPPPPSHNPGPANASHTPQVNPALGLHDKAHKCISEYVVCFNLLYLICVIKVNTVWRKHGCIGSFRRWDFYYCAIHYSHGFKPLVCVLWLTPSVMVINLEFTFLFVTSCILVCW